MWFMENEHVPTGNSDDWARLNSSEIRYRRLFEAAHDGILLVDPDTRKIIDANPFMAQLLGYDRDELVGKELWEIGLLRDEEQSKEAFRILQEAGSIRYEDMPLKSKDGRAHDVEFVSNVYKEGDRNVIQCNIRDITERKRAEIAVRNAEERFRLMVESVEDYAIFSTDRQGLIDSWNTGAERVFGYTDPEIIGQPFSTIFTPEDRASGRPEFEMNTAAEKGRADDERWQLRICAEISA
jgi:two-component system cell cycle sensor histidine kinase/response regulator CckA